MNKFDKRIRGLLLYLLGVPFIITLILALWGWVGVAWHWMKFSWGN